MFPPILLRARGVLILSIVALLAVLGAVVVLALQTDTREVRALRTPGAVVAVTAGEAPLVLGANGKKWLLGAFPGYPLPIDSRVFPPGGGGKTALVVWQATLARGVWNHPNYTRLPVLLTGDRGETMRVGFGQIGGRLLKEDILAVNRLDTFPRRGKQFRIRFVGAGSG